MYTMQNQCRNQWKSMEINARIKPEDQKPKDTKQKRPFAMHACNLTDR